ncbi:MAG: heme ABC transporter ATP-binding protein [Panacagrimonas sp.]
MLRAKGLGCVLGGRSRLSGVDLDIHPGEVLAVLGPNGAGKSSLLRCLSADLVTVEGSVELNGRPLSQWSALQLAQQRAVLPQAGLLQFPFVVRDVVGLGRYPWQPESAARSGVIVEAAMQRTGIAMLADRIYTHLSTGERARVQFARVLTQIWEATSATPRYLLLDEPTASLDLAHQHELLAMTRCFAASGVGVVMVVHDLNLALLYADRCLLLRNGRALAIGTSAAVLDEANIREAFDIDVQLLRSPGRDLPWIMPIPHTMRPDAAVASCAR